MKFCNEIQEYIDLIQQNKVEHCKDQELMLKNIVLPVLKRKDVWIDEEAIQKGLSLQKYFSFNLFTWEKFMFALIVGVKFMITNEIFFKDIKIFVGRGAGKNGFISYLAFYFLSEYHGVQKYDIDILANSEEQAKTSFNDVYEVIDSPINPKAKALLLKKFHVTKEKIVGTDTASTLRYNTSSKRGKDSKRSGCIFFDEEHEGVDFANIHTLISGLGKVPNGRAIHISTDGTVRGGIMDRYKEQAAHILEKYNPNNRTLIFYCHLEIEEEWKDSSKWIKANPSIDDFPELKSTIQLEVDNMAFTPEYFHVFMAKRMNFPVGDSENEVASWKDIVATTSGKMADLTGKQCIVGIDYARSNDFMAVFALFKIAGKYYGICHGWVCKNSKDLMGIKAPIDEWVKAGYLTMVDDVEISPSLIVGWIKAFGKTHKIKQIVMDSFRFSYLNIELKKAGFDGNSKDGKKVKLVRKNDMIKAAVIINSIFVSHKLSVGENPYWRWNVNNTKKVIKNDGNMEYQKIEPLFRKNDLFMAFVCAVTSEDLLTDVSRARTIKTITS